MLIELERTARVLVHCYDLVQEVGSREIHALARAAKTIQMAYGKE